jgi:hypothetical protein
MYETPTGSYIESPHTKSFKHEGWHSWHLKGVSVGAQGVSAYVPFLSPELGSVGLFL